MNFNDKYFYNRYLEDKSISDDAKLLIAIMCPCMEENQLTKVELNQLCNFVEELTPESIKKCLNELSEKNIVFFEEIDLDMFIVPNYFFYKESILIWLKKKLDLFKDYYVPRDAEFLNKMIDLLFSTPQKVDTIEKLISLNDKDFNFAAGYIHRFYSEENKPKLVKREE